MLSPRLREDVIGGEASRDIYAYPNITKSHGEIEVIPESLTYPYLRRL